MTRRPGTSVVLILGALVLLIAIVVGNSMGNRVLGQIASRNEAGIATPIPIASTPPPDTSANRVLWKRRQVLTVATDPAFPDPRITPEPEIPATPRPRPTPRRTAKPTPEASPSDVGDGSQTPDTTYTSPPLPLPIASHGPDETASPETSPTSTLRPASGRGTVPTPNRNNPTPPPVSQPSSNP